MKRVICWLAMASIAFGTQAPPPGPLAVAIDSASSAVAGNEYCSPSGAWIGPTTDGPAALPIACYYTAVSATPSPGTVRGPVSTLSAFNSAYSAAACGDTILVQAGSSLTQAFLGGKNCDDAHYITIKSTGVGNASFPAEGTRVSPCISAITSLPGRLSYPCPSPQVLTAQFVAPSSGSAVYMGPADHIRFIGIEFTRVSTPGALIFSLVDLGSQNNSASHSHHIIFDRCYFHGIEGTFPQSATTDTSTTRALYLAQSNHVAVIDSYIANIYDNGSVASNGNTDAQCVGGGTGGKPQSGWGVYKFVNNHCEGASEGLILGGANGPALTPSGCTFGVDCNLDVPTDIEVRENYFFAPNFWNGNTSSINSFGWPNRKNGIEFKTGARILLEANVMENCWYSSQPYCYVFDFAPKNQSNGNGSPTCPSCLVQDFTARDNYGYNYPGAMIATYSTMDRGCTTCTTMGRRGSIHDNLVGDKLNRGSLTITGFDGAEFSADAGPMTQLEIRHNTVVNGWRSFLLMSAANGVFNQLKIQDNIGTYTQASQGSPFLAGDGCAVSQTFSTFLSSCTQNWAVDHNAVFNAANLFGWPAGNTALASASAVGFVNYSGGDSNVNPGNYSLTATSPLHNAGSDGKDIGADISTLQSKIAGVRQ